MIRLDVRCCCQPTKVLGSLPIDEDWLERGRTIKFPLRSGQVIELPIEQWGESRMTIDGIMHYAGGLAFKSEETPIDILRQIPGFVEASTEYAVFTPDVPEFFAGGRR